MRFDVRLVTQVPRLPAQESRGSLCPGITISNMRAKSYVPDEPEDNSALDPFEFAAQAFEHQSVPISEFYDDPVGFVREFVDFSDSVSGAELGLTEYQDEIMDAVPKHGRVAVRGPHGLGKTTTNALTVLWFAITREDAKRDWKVATTAGAWRQLEHYLWPEIKKWSRKLRWDKLGMTPWREGTSGELLSLSLNLTYGSAFAVASSDEKKIEGVHADSVLYIFDESKAIRPQVFEAAEGAFSGAPKSTGERPSSPPALRGLEAYAMAASTPGEPQGHFYEIHMNAEKFPDWNRLHVTLNQVIRAGRISPDWADARKHQWGEDSAAYQNRVLGNFYASSADAVIPLSWVEDAIERWQVWVKSGRRRFSQTKVFGVDVALDGADFTGVARRCGHVIEGVEKLRLSNTVKIATEVEKRMGPGDDSVVDVIGVGAGVRATLQERGKKSRPFTASKKSYKKDLSKQYTFLNRRAEMWWGMRELLDPAFEPDICLPPDDQLIGELTAPKWTVTAGSKIQVESKKDIRKRLGRSTDLADCVLQTFASPESESESHTDRSGSTALLTAVQQFQRAPSVEEFEPGAPAPGVIAFGRGSDQVHSFAQWEQELDRW